jgi:excinuclease ABC subunit C
MLEQCREDIPNLPGVYHFKKQDKILYVGKANNLKKRIKSYFTKRLAIKDRKIIEQSDSIDYIVTENEIEALILEENEIKEKQPKYNIRLKDDKRYPYIKVTVSEEYPRIYYTRKIEEGGSLYFGPYTNVGAVKRALRTIRDIFPIRTCEGKDLPLKPCLDYYIGRCIAPCIGKVTKEQYREFIDEAIDFLKGNTKKIEKIIDDKMWNASKTENFEMAAMYRNQLMSIRELSKKQTMVLRDKTSRDIVGIEQKHGLACIVVFQIREGKMVHKEHYFLDSIEKSEISEYLQRFLGRRYSKVSFVPEEIVISKTIKDKNLVEEWLNTKIHIPRRGNLKRLINMANKNAKLELDKELARPTQRTTRALFSLQEILALERVPTRIEGFDISNISGTDSVGSCVVFINGVPSKKNYRKFKIKKIKNTNDPAMIGEVVSRRIKRLLSNDNLPDLILIDGGMGQLNAAINVMKNLMVLEVPVIALAKRLEEIYLPTGKIMSLSRSSPALKLLMRIRNEAHRFALDYHRRLRKKRITFSELDQIEGIAYKRKIALIQHFGSLNKLLKASREEIEKVSGIGRKLAEVIYNYIH